MKHTIFRTILLNREGKRKMLAVLIDPEKCIGRRIASVIAMLKTAVPDFVFIGGSHAVKSLDSMIELIKEEINVPVILFPGDASQFSYRANALLYLSLISGRNPEYLIGQHVKSALEIYESGMEVIPTAYVLIDGGKTSSVELISNTRSIPPEHKDIILATVQAGELLGMHLTYLEAGSGAKHPVPANIIKYIRERSSLPLIVGGGVSNTHQLEEAFTAGADLVVIGNSLEKKPELLKAYVECTKAFNDKIITKIAKEKAE